MSDGVGDESGIAQLIAALEISPGHEVMLVTESRLVFALAYDSGAYDSWAAGPSACAEQSIAWEGACF